MISNFDYLRNIKEFSTFVDGAILAEKMVFSDPNESIVHICRSMEAAIKWMYSVDTALEKPYQETLASLMDSEDYRELVGSEIWRRMDYIRRCAHQVEFGKKKLSVDQAMLCLENLFIFLDFISYCYTDNQKKHTFDQSIVSKCRNDVVLNVSTLNQKEESLEQLMHENAFLKNEFSKRRAHNRKSYAIKPLELSEFKTRKLYIDSMLLDAGWHKNQDWIDEVRIEGMPNKSNVGFADYVLYDDRHRPLAVIEAKKTCVDVSKGRQQAKLYADLLEKEYGRRPVIFLTNGFETRIIDGQYPERKCSTIYSKRDLNKWFNLKEHRQSLNNITVDPNIAGRYYQKAAIKAVCENFDEKNRRKALLVMATGSGKTRTVIALCDCLLKAGWIRNILFLADRNSLVTQAKRSFTNLLPNLSCANLVEDKEHYQAHCIFSTYQTMINCIDTVNDEDGRLFTCGHFDLVICDEAHRSIYNKYKDIFTYFDAPLVGLTATPKDEIDRNTYHVFELEQGVPTYGYDLAQAVNDGYLVDYVSVETKLKFLEEGIVYDDLSDEEKRIYEKTFLNEDGIYPDCIKSSNLNKWVFNEDTIKKVLHILMDSGLKIDYGQKIGKTIIFAQNHNHAEKILEIFNREFPHLPGYAMVIDNYINYAQSAIDEFSDPKSLPQIAISVDMLDTGIDVPEILNLVFFKKVLSKAKFWQMIGRGTRLCPYLVDGHDKEKFYIFDFCGNFEFFRLKKQTPDVNLIPLQGAIFSMKFEMCYALLKLENHSVELQEYRDELVEDLVDKVQELPRNNFAVQQHLRYVEEYSNPSIYDRLTYADVVMARQELAHLILPDQDHVQALRFDALLYGIQLKYLTQQKYGRSCRELSKKVYAISKVRRNDYIDQQRPLIDRILTTDYLERADILDFEEIRIRLRDLMQYLPKDKIRYDVDFVDFLIDTEWVSAELEDDQLINYKAKAEYYIKQHQDMGAIAKLKTNQPLTSEDVKKLETVLWQEIGTKEDYEAEIGKKPVGKFVREIVGLDMNAAKRAFARYLNDANLDSNQIYFLNQIVEYIVQNGMLEDTSVLMDTPFTDHGSISDVFKDMKMWNGIMDVIESINANAMV